MWPIASVVIGCAHFLRSETCRREIARRVYELVSQLRTSSRIRSGQRPKGLATRLSLILLVHQAWSPTSVILANGYVIAFHGILYSVDVTCVTRFYQERLQPARW